jgi:hypothetical protein
MAKETEGEHPDPLEALDQEDRELEEIDFEEFGDAEEADTEGPPSDE